jgi:anti-anti-sigma regulatory factor
MVIAGPQVQVKRILEVSGINKIIGIYEDNNSALGQLL